MPHYSGIIYEIPSRPRAARPALQEDSEWVDEDVKYETQGFSKISPDSEVLMVDNDVLLRCTDGAEFKVHPYPLMKSSSYFRAIFQQSGVPYPLIALEQDGSTIGAIMSLLCPGDLEPARPTTEQLLPILQAVKKLEINSHVVRTWLAACLEEEKHPLRSWALATAFKYPEARRVAIERYMTADSYFLENRPAETRRVDGWSLFELISSKGRAMTTARVAMTDTDWGCDQCVPPPPRCSCGCGFLVGECRFQARALSPARGYPASRSISPCPPSPKDDTPETPCVADITVIVNTIRDPIILPLWRREYHARSATMNPLGREAASDIFFELCALASGCAGCRAAYNTGRAKSGREGLRIRIQDILACAITEAFGVSLVRDTVEHRNLANFFRRLQRLEFFSAHVAYMYRYHVQFLHPPPTSPTCFISMLPFRVFTLTKSISKLDLFSAGSRCKYPDS